MSDPNAPDVEWLAATEKGVEILALPILRAWQANSAVVYPEGNAVPDPGVLAEYAARAAWAFFVEVLQHASAAGAEAA